MNEWRIAVGLLISNTGMIVPEANCQRVNIIAIIAI
jgi:hypothetical protein